MTRDPWWHRLSAHERRTVALYQRHTSLWRTLRGWWLVRRWPSEVLTHETDAFARGQHGRACHCAGPAASAFDQQ